MATELLSDLLAICRQIDSGDLTPRAGAARMWSMMADADYPPETDEFRVFSGLASEIQDDPEHATAYATDNVEQARKALLRHPAK